MAVRVFLVLIRIILNSQIERVEIHGPPRPDRKTLFVEAVVLADRSLYRHYGSRQDTEQHIAQVLSAANRVRPRLTLSSSLPATCSFTHSRSHSLSQ